MKDNKGGIVDFPLRYIEDNALIDSLEPLKRNCHGLITDEELYKGAQLAKGRRTPVRDFSHVPMLTYRSGSFARRW